MAFRRIGGLSMTLFVEVGALGGLVRVHLLLARKEDRREAPLSLVMGG